MLPPAKNEDKNHKWCDLYARERHIWTSRICVFKKQNNVTKDCL